MPAADNFAAIPDSTTSPLEKSFVITAGTDPDEVTRAFMCTVGGDISAKLAQDSSFVTIPVDANVVYPFRIKEIQVSGTTATGLIGFA